MNTLCILALKNESNKKEALFSAISHILFNPGLTVNIFTDDEDWFRSKIVQLSGIEKFISIFPFPLQIRTLEKNFTYKLNFILSQYSGNEKLVYCDTDAFSFAAWPKEVFENNSLYFSKFEYDIMKCRNFRDRHIKTFVIPFLNKRHPDFKGKYLMYNSGFLSIPGGKRKEIENAEKLSEILYEHFPMFHQLEQLSLSFFLHGNHISTTESFLCHYWAVKTYMHKEIDRLDFQINAIKDWLKNNAFSMQKKQLGTEHLYFHPSLPKRLRYQFKLIRKNF